MTTTISPQLHYALAPPRRRKRVMLILIAGALLVLGVAAWRWGGIVWNRLPLLFWQRQCMRYTASADQVVYEEDPTELAKLLSRTAEYTRLTIASPFGLSRLNPGTPAAVRVTAEWLRFSSLYRPAGIGGGWPEPVLFLHERTSPAGHRRVVSIVYTPRNESAVSSFIAGFNYMDNVLIPATATKGVQLPRKGYFLSVLSGGVRSPPNVRFYAGQPDPKDLSHFTIHYRMWNQDDVLDGYLDDRDRVSLKPRRQLSEP